MAIYTDIPPEPPPPPPPPDRSRRETPKQQSEKKRWFKPAIHVVDDSVLYTGSGPAASIPPAENAQYHVPTS